MSIALELLKTAAVRLADKGVDQWGHWLNPPPDKTEWLETGFLQGAYFILDKEQIIGMYRITTEDLEYWGVQEAKAMYLHSLVVLPKYAGKGIGSNTVQHVQKLAIKGVMEFLRLDCHAGNKALCAYYENQGFQKVGQKQMPHSLNNLYEKKL